jgi:steroid delta-isomerase-like uncharacterized protein
MTRDEIVAFFNRRMEGLNRLDAAMVASLHTEDGVVDSPFGGGIAEGREAIERVYEAFFKSFSTAEFRLEQLLIDGERVALLAHIHGTNKGGVLGLPPTDRPFSISLVSLCDMRDGLIARERRIYDFTGMLLQVGAIKAKPA